MILLGDLTIGIGRMRIRNKFVRATTKSFVGNKMIYFAHNMRLGESLQHAGGVILAKKFCSAPPPVVSLKSDGLRQALNVSGYFRVPLYYETISTFYLQFDNSQRLFTANENHNN